MPVPASASAIGLLDSFNVSADYESLGSPTSVCDAFSEAANFVGAVGWVLGNNVCVASTGTTNFTAANSPTFDRVAAYLTDGINDQMSVSTSTPHEGGMGQGTWESYFLGRNPDLLGYDVDFIHLVVNRLSLTPSGNGTHVQENYTWQFWGHPTYVTFLPFTDPDGTIVIDRRNTSVAVTLAEPGTAVLEWNGANTSMTPTDGTGRNFSIAVGGLANGRYLYRVWAANGTGGVFVSDSRSFTGAVGIWGFDPAGSGYFPSLAYDALGNPHICFWGEVSGTPTGLMYGSRDATGWHVETVVPGSTGSATGQSCSIAMDSQGHPHISFVEGLSAGSVFNVSYATNNGTAWIVQVVHTGSFTQTSIVLNPVTGNPLIAFSDFSLRALQLAQYSSGTWLTVTVDSSYTGEAFRVVADPQGIPEMAYVSDAGALVWARWVGGATWWSKTVVDPNALGGAPSGLSAELDSHGLPHIAYLAGSEVFAGTQVMYAVFNGTAWSTEMVDAAPSIYLAMTLDPSDHAHVVYGWATEVDVRYAVEGNGSWARTLVANDYNGPGFAIGTAANGSVGILYNSNARGLGLLTCIVDCTPPVTRAVLAGLGGTAGWFRSDVSVTLVARDDVAVANTSYQVDAGPWLSYTGPFVVRGAGNHTFRDYSTDRVGNVEPIESTTFGIDTVPPAAAVQISGTAGKAGWYVSAARVTLTATDDQSGVAGISYELDGGPWIAYEASFDVTDGNHTLRYFATDRAGNNGTVASAPLGVDTSPPVLSVGSVPAIVTTSTVTVSWSAKDLASGIASYKVMVDSGALQDLGTATSWTSTLSDGAHVVTVTAVNGAGNTTQESVSFRVDTNVFSPSGPYGGVPTYAIVAAAVAVAAFVLWRRRRAMPAAPPPEDSGRGPS